MPRHKVFSDVVEINAPVEKVWQILVDFEHYPQWNPFTYRVETDLKVGSPVDLYVKLPSRGSRLQTEYIREVVEPTKLSWGMEMGSKYLLTALREQYLTPISETRCSYYSTDLLQGGLTPIVKLLFAKSIQQGFNNMAYALKQRAESL